MAETVPGTVMVPVPTVVVAPVVSLVYISFRVYWVSSPAVPEGVSVPMAWTIEAERRMVPRMVRVVLTGVGMGGVSNYEWVVGGTVLAS